MKPLVHFPGHAKHDPGPNRRPCAGPRIAFGVRGRGYAGHLVTGPLDFAGQSVLVVGGSSGIGNGIAQAFRGAGATVHVWGSRASATDYRADEGSDLSGLHYTRVDVADDAAIAAAAPGIDRLDVLVLCQGTVLYDRQEFKMPGFRKVLDVNLMSLMACADAFHAMLARSRGALIIVSSTAAFHSTKGNPAYNASKAGAVGLARTLAEAYARDGIRVKRHRAGPGRHEAHESHDGQPRAPRGEPAKNPDAPPRHAAGHGGCRAVPCFAARGLCAGPDDHRRRRAFARLERDAKKWNPVFSREIPLCTVSRSRFMILDGSFRNHRDLERRHCAWT